MIEIEALINEVINATEKLRSGKATTEELERVTTSIMLHEDYEKTDEEFQGIIELLDTAEIQNLSEQQIGEMLEHLRTYIR